uniref:Uncharacterized protein n=1 Tax=Medicago truncatula TaxID=3880 RepID=I3SAR7_MEDTR|nr:unknown [Medicago truncatula]
MHNPISFGAFWSFTNIKNKCFFDTNFSTFICYNLVCSSCFPIPRSSYSIWPCPIWILPISWTKEIPFFLPKNGLTWKNPWVEFVEINFSNDLKRKMMTSYFAT